MGSLIYVKKHLGGIRERKNVPFLLLTANKQDYSIGIIAET
jgi:hypothetical protein